MTKDKEEMKDWLSKQSATVQKNVKIVTPEDVSQDFMLRIDKVFKSTFTVMHLPRSGKNEDKTTPRICVSPILFGCMIGYGSYIFDHQDGSDSDIVKFNGYRGGYIISKFPFQACLYPNKHLVYDSPNTLEHWLVNYNENTKQYSGIEIGKRFIKEFTLISNSKFDPHIKMTVYLEHSEKNGIFLTKKIRVDPGYYKVEVNFFSQNTASCTDEDSYVISKIGAGEYMSAKNLSADMLSHNRPKYLSWE